MNMLRDSIKYISDAVKIVDHSELGLIAIIRKNDAESLQRALNTVGYRIIGSRKKSNGDAYYSLEEVNNGSSDKGSSTKT